VTQQEVGDFDLGEDLGQLADLADDLS